ncbi:hypothetical protein [Pediococcus ethanolidurans]|uniref:DUF4352 domain-containing protein n=1 Tax=Pediococcus ethanolidurans TaxID=319653 RepID=A0A0R2KB13_9LACO|nr:hypothetical protein [Pediococcus ethanolidurans]KRN83453.1 hypothetical protein IV87_GL000885 [Pediococcus ethanolidurans]GEN94445.1 hypothetical protein PET01_04950 [Pediococcus ethanolidurans]SER24680.1 hypothetical protein SAMN04487973_103103 [Pediococcus ethanolidurans]
MKKHKLGYILGTILIVIVLIIGGVTIYHQGVQEGKRIAAKTILSATNEKSSSTETESDSSGTDSSEDSESSESDDNTITLDDEDYEVTDSKDYKPVFSDSSWTNTKVGIDEVKVLQSDGTTEDSDGNEVNGIVAVHYTIDAGKDINMYPTQGTMNTNSGEQVEADMSASDDFDGELNSGASVDGWVIYFLKKLDSIKDLTSVRLKWDADYDTDDIDDDNFSHTYDATVQLN